MSMFKHMERSVSEDGMDPVKVTPEGFRQSKLHSKGLSGILETRQ